MLNDKKKYLTLLAIHVLIGLSVFFIKKIALLYAFAVIVIGLIYLLKTSNKNNEVLILAGYVVGIEVFLRMTGGAFINEYGKYTVILFLFLGIIYSGFDKRAFLFWFFIALLLPATGIAIYANTIDVNLRKSIAFNLSGPLSLALAAIYCYKRSITIEKLMYVLLAMVLPMISILVYLILYTPNIRDVVIGTDSNFSTSGGFGPNQMSTALGLGMFIMFAILILKTKSKLLLAINFFLVLFFAYRCILTFSRGGLITGVVMIAVLLFNIYLKSNRKAKTIIAITVTIAVMATTVVWSITSFQTGGLIDKRYANQDAQGRVKQDRLGGREVVNGTDFQIFLDNPLLGVGVGRSKKIREELTGLELAAHNEITRLLAEHGVLGLIAIILLLVTPLLWHFQQKEHILSLSFFFFWLLTINHAAMRIAAPGFLYGLSLLKVQFYEKKDTLPRE